MSQRIGRRTQQQKEESAKNGMAVGDKSKGLVDHGRLGLVSSYTMGGSIRLLLVVALLVVLIAIVEERRPA